MGPFAENARATGREQPETQPDTRPQAPPRGIRRGSASERTVNPSSKTCVYIWEFAFNFRLDHFLLKIARSTCPRAKGRSFGCQPPWFCFFSACAAETRSVSEGRLRSNAEGARQRPRKNGSLRKGKKIKPNRNQARTPTEYVADCSIFRPLAGLGFKRLLIADGRKIAIGHTWVLKSVTEPRCGVMPLVTDFP